MTKAVPIYVPCFNGKDFHGMMRLVRSAEGPEWGGAGNYVREADFEAVVKYFEGRIEDLQRALAFWLPDKKARPSIELEDRVLHDLLLLIGMNDENPEKTAEELGWIHVEV
jgi:hypothetical protein